MPAVKFTLNGKPQTVDVVPAMPLLWVLRDTLGMTGTKFGCGMALCGACTVHINGQPMRSCVHADFERRRQERHHHRRPSPDSSHPVQLAWIEEDVPQCGYCQSGQIMTAAALLAKTNESHRRRYRRSHARQHLPLRNLRRHPQRGSPGGGNERAKEVPDERTGESPQLSASHRGGRGRPAGRLLPARELAAGRGYSSDAIPSSTPSSTSAPTTRDAVHPQGRNGAGDGDLALHAAGRRAGVRLEQDPHRIPGRRSASYGPQPGRGGQRRASAVRGSRCARPARPRARCWSRPRRRSGAWIRPQCRAENNMVDQHRRQRPAELWQPGRSRVEAAGAHQRHAQGSQAVPPRSASPRSVSIRRRKSMAARPSASTCGCPGCSTRWSRAARCSAAKWPASTPPRPRPSRA